MKRRDVLLTLPALAAGAWVANSSGQAYAQTGPGARSANGRLGVGAIGLRYQGTVDTVQAREFGNIVALCDVDRHVREQSRASFGSTPAIMEDYRDLLKRKDVDVVLIGTPDHWHTKMVIDACRAGKDVYCEKPLTLTIEEGQIMSRVVKETGRIVQVGSWQRSDHRFRRGVEMVRQGRIGTLRKVEVVLGKNVVGGPFAPSQPPRHFNWDLWQGQTPDVPYIEERSHYTFRWWREYSGGQLTDWGAHHMDIARWGIGSDPVAIEGTGTFPETPNGYNVPTNYSVSYKFANGVEMTVADNGRNGVMFTGDEGRIFVNRENLAGKAVDALAQQPLPREKFSLYAHDNLERPERAGKLDAITNHMGNFFDCVVSRNQPISPVDDQHRSISVSHLGNISIELGRPLKWNPADESFVDDKEANAKRARPQRAGFEIR